ncbi:hypothetical protein BK816_03575 [Boudabousia tangfeifanii]|uniref:M23ase beta-sheet core domain-containing protein n=1 Tax=Boudabousia tangfeifanii TaxID=1912795 RepID=A0A1D9MJK6_9ACTO|nr:M23 family metallopeptidase [Boudabousia tangfeifanii]AOZ72487.1 hypothetical protein BK816_03575 [Boudabousia tangfeifanii]
MTENGSEAMPKRQYPSRRALRGAQQARAYAEASRVPETSSSSSQILNRSVRSLMVGALGFATVVVPLSGFISPEVANQAKIKRAQSWADILQSKVQAAEALSLRSDPAAATRAAVREQLEADKCLKTDSSANGVRTALTEKPEEPVGQDLFWPLARGTYRLSSGFGMRVNPVLGIYRLHAGIDMAGGAGTPITSAADGIVSRVGWISGLGYSVAIYHPTQNVTTVYGHMISGSSPLHQGQELKAGDFVGKLGSTGNSTGPHLHFEVHRGKDDNDGSAVEPLSWMKNNGAIYSDEAKAEPSC